MKGIEPSWPAWKAGTLPLSYTRISVIYKYFLKWWRGWDLNLRTLTRADLQSAAIDHSATPPKSKPKWHDNIKKLNSQLFPQILQFLFFLIVVLRNSLRKKSKIKIFPTKLSPIFKISRIVVVA